MLRRALNLPRRSLLVTSLTAAFLPVGGQVFQGVAGKPTAAYQQAVAKHPAVLRAIHLLETRFREPWSL